MVRMTRTHFETEENRQLYWAEWRETTFSRVIMENPTKDRLECLQLLFDKLQKIQRGMSEVYQTEHNLRDMIINACRVQPHGDAGAHQGVMCKFWCECGTQTLPNAHS